MVLLKLMRIIMFKEFETIQNKQKELAKEWVKQPHIQDFKSSLNSFNFNGLHNEHLQINAKEITESPIREMYNNVTTFALNETINDNITKEAKDFPSVQFKQIAKNISAVTNEYYYRVLALLDADPKDAPTSWISKSLMQSKIYRSFEGTGNRIEKDKIYNPSDISTMEGQIASQIHERDFGQRLYTFYDSEKYPLDKTIQSFLDANEFKELTELLSHLTTSADGRYKSMSRKDVENIVIASALTRITGRSDIGPGDISELKESGVIKNKSLWNTDFFNKNIAPSVTDKGMESGKKYNDSWLNKKHVIHEIKNELSKSELFNLFINQSLSNIDTWKFAINRYAAFTGEKLSLQDARDLDPRHGFQLSWTQAFSDHTDKTLDANSYQTFDIEVIENDDDFNNEDDDYVFSSFVISSKSLYLDDIQDSIEKMTLTIPEGDSSAYGGDCVRLTFEIEKSELSNRIPEIKLMLEMEMKKQISENILPGDVATIIDPEGCDPASEYGLTVGKKVLVTDIESGGDYKIKGNKSYHNTEMFELRKKHSHNKNLSSNLSL
jgi:hypothetical protein